GKPALDQVPCDRLAHATADVEDRAAVGQQGGEPVQPRPLEQVPAALAVPGRRVLLVQADDPLVHGSPFAAPRPAAVARRRQPYRLVPPAQRASRQPPSARRTVAQAGPPSLAVPSNRASSLA